MSDTKWADCPWHLARIGNDICILDEQNGGIAVVDVMDSGAQEASTGHLISAAPDLYNVVDAILESKHPDVKLQPDQLAAAYRARAKARGES